MKKETLIQIILGTVGGVVSSVGMSMCLLPEWNMMKPGILTAVAGFFILFLMIPVWRSTHPRKNHIKIKGGFVTAILIGIAGVLSLGFGMSRIMVGQVTQKDLFIGLTTGIAGLMICILLYPVYAYIKQSKKE